MKIMTDGPVDLCFSNGSGPSPETITAIGQTVGQLGSSLAQRQRQYTEVEQKCGKKPSLPGKRFNRWNDCAKEYAKSAGVSPTTFTSDVPVSTSITDDTQKQPSKKVPTWVWVVGGLVIAGGIGFAIYKSTKK